MKTLEEDFKNWFSQRLRELRDQEGMTQKAFAEHAMIGKATIERLERGKALADLDTCVRVARTLGISLSALFEGYSYD